MKARGPYLLLLLLLLLDFAVCMGGLLGLQRVYMGGGLRGRRKGRRWLVVGERSLPATVEVTLCCVV